MSEGKNAKIIAEAKARVDACDLMTAWNLMEQLYRALETADARNADLEGISARETCRECRDELPHGSTLPEARFILWGKLFPPDAFGPKCYGHASKWFNTARADQYAVYDLQPNRVASIEHDRVIAEKAWDAAIDADREGARSDPSGIPANPYRANPEPKEGERD